VTTTPVPATLAPDLRLVGSSPHFTADTVPPALLQRHATREGFWARLVVSAGALVYTDLATGAEKRVAEGETLVVPPTLPHRVQIEGPVDFHLDFYECSP
jgi:tellurite resistance-related uncharacterized protein